MEEQAPQGMAVKGLSSGVRLPVFETIAQFFQKKNEHNNTTALIHKVAMKITWEKIYKEFSTMPGTKKALNKCCSYYWTI